VNARSFFSCSVKSRSIASAPISPTLSLYVWSRTALWELIRSTPVTVCNSPAPW